MVSSRLILVCTQMPTVFCSAKLFVYDEYVFIDQSEMFFFRFFRRLVILGADQKDRSLWERDCVRGLESLSFPSTYFINNTRLSSYNNFLG